VYVAGLREDIVSSSEQVCRAGRHHRHTTASPHCTRRAAPSHACTPPLLCWTYLRASSARPLTPMMVPHPQVLELLEGGERYRHFGETKMNKNSSRSHTVFRMVVESRSRDCNPDDAQVRALVTKRSVLAVHWWCLVGRSGWLVECARLGGCGGAHGGRGEQGGRR
jgi:hypothetical protein